MDLVTFTTAGALNVEPKLMHALIWRQSGGEPWSFSAQGESLPRVLAILQDAVHEAQATRPEGDRIRLGLTGLSINPRSVTALMFAPCPNVTFAARLLTQLIERCKRTAKRDPTYCAIAAYRGSWDRPDIGFADAVRTTVDESSAPNFDLPKDAYFDASDIASSRPTGKPHAALTTPMSKPDERTLGWSSALFPARARTADGTSAGARAGDRAAEEPRLSRPAAAVPDTTNAPIDNLFVPSSPERRP